MERTVNTSAYQKWFKEFYGAQGQNLENVKTPLLSILQKNARVDWVGDYFIAPLRFDVATGLGYRAQGQNLPTPGAALRDRALFRAAKAYGTCEYEREVIVQSRNDKGAFAKATVDEAEALVEGYNLHMLERAFFGDASGKLAEVDSAVVAISGAGTTASPWVFGLANVSTNAPKGKTRYFPQGARLDLFTSAGVYQMTIKVVSVVAASNGDVTMSATTVAIGNSNTPVDADLIYWEGNKDQECVGFAKIAPSSAGTLYGLSQTTYPKMRGLYKDLSSAALTYDDVNNLVSDLEEESESPNLLITSHKALANLKNQAEEHKRYNVAEAKSSGGLIGFKGIEVMTDEGPVPLIASKMCPDNELIMMNTKYLQIVKREDFGWFDDDGSVLMRDRSKDVYEARYGGYFELFCNKPNSVSRIVNFAL